jgi:hypothetical protein
MEQCRVMPPPATHASGLLQPQQLHQHQQQHPIHLQQPSVASVGNPYDAASLHEEYRMNEPTSVAAVGWINGKAVSIFNEDAAATQPTIGAATNGASAEVCSWTQSQPEMISEYTSHWREDDGGVAMKQPRADSQYRQYSPSYRRHHCHYSQPQSHRDEQYFADQPQQFSVSSLGSGDYTRDVYNVAADATTLVHYYNI